MKATRLQAGVDVALLVATAKKILTVPDHFASAHLNLRQINGETSQVPPQAKRAIVDVCDPLHIAIADVAGMDQCINDWLALNGGPITVTSDGMPKNAKVDY